MKQNTLTRIAFIIALLLGLAPVFALAADANTGVNAAVTATTPGAGCHGCERRAARNRPMGRVHGLHRAGGFR